MNSLFLSLEKLRLAINQKDLALASELIRELKVVVAKFSSLNPSKSEVNPQELEFTRTFVSFNG